MRFKEFFELIKQTYTAWNDDKAPRLGAALAYYTVFSIAPLLVIIIAVIGFFFGAEAARGEISSQIARVVGKDAAGFIQNMVASAGKPGSGTIAMIVGAVTLLLGAMGVFGQLQDALNTIWKVPPPPKQPLWQTIKTRLTPFLMVIVIAFLLLVSLSVSAVINILGSWMQGILPLPGWVLQAVNFGVGFFIITLLFALIFKILPDVQIEWRDVWIGAAVTTLLFLIGQLGLSWYVSKTAASSAYGAAGSLVAVLLWVYWTAQILFFGAEFTQLFANKYGSKLLTAPDATSSITQVVSAPITAKQIDQKIGNTETLEQNNFIKEIMPIAAGFGMIVVIRRFLGRK